MQYKKFRIGDLFYKPDLKFIGEYPFKYIKRGNLSKIRNKEFDLPLVNAKHGDNGIMYYGRLSDFEYVENSIAIIADGAVSTGDVYPQIHKTGVLYNAYLIKPFTDLKREALIYLSVVIKKSVKLKFSYENKATWNKIKTEQIELPVMSEGSPDYDYMTARIRELEAARIRELEAYLKVTGLRDYILTEKEKKILVDYRRGGGGG
ncbi:MAG: hypothetical protein LBD46_05520 [Endomicrobium sp.]|jgi:hypothetical protein|nr:hypothetical protein [Endomicrobium sp.]